MKKFNFKHTVTACFIGYMVQAIVCNFAPLLFVSWEKEFNISMPQLTTIVTLTFFTQIVIDLLSAKFADKIGYKKCLFGAHLFSGIGFLLLAILPYILPNPFIGIVISVVLYSVGSGLLEVLVSPVVESCPSDNKAGAMSLLHSFYCWGTVGVIALSTIFFAAFGRENWRILTIVWAVFAIFNGIFFCLVPIIEPKDEPADKKSGSLFKNKIFIIAIVLMICSGAAELAMSQWASTFAETALGVSKTIGDLAGPMAFAVLMGAGRIIFSKLSKSINTEKYLIASASLCIISYLLACLSPNAIISLVGCALCGLSVSAMWPGTISLSTRAMPNISTAMFAFLAVAGDIGCTSGPTLIGWLTDAVGGDLKKGLLFAIIFPVIMILAMLLMRKESKKLSK
ncbi:MAG: MFS transporter [Eubacterium sp.]|nr:MFS transporter [Eubacterium sp.]